MKFRPNSLKENSLLYIVRSCAFIRLASYLNEGEGKTAMLQMSRDHHAHTATTLACAPFTKPAML